MLPESSSAEVALKGPDVVQVEVFVRRDVLGKLDQWSERAYAGEVVDPYGLGFRATDADDCT